MKFDFDWQAVLEVKIFEIVNNDDDHNGPEAWVYYKLTL